MCLYKEIAMTLRCLLAWFPYPNLCRFFLKDFFNERLSLHVKVCSITFLNALLPHPLHLQKGYQNARHSLVTMEERVWKMIMTKKDSNALALKNIKGNIVKVQNVIHMMVTQTQWRVNFLRQVNFMCARVNRIEAIYKGSRVNVKVEKGSTCMFTRELSYIASTLINARKNWPACTRKKSAIVEIHLKGFFFFFHRLGIYKRQRPIPLVEF